MFECPQEHVKETIELCRNKNLSMKHCPWNFVALEIMYVLLHMMERKVDNVSAMAKKIHLCSWENDW